VKLKRASSTSNCSAGGQTTRYSALNGATGQCTRRLNTLVSFLQDLAWKIKSVSSVKGRWNPSPTQTFGF